ncbi:MAG: hypothetical protein M1820_001369 [Bogoriella megaspora]|nr:MAG: hypothetical protein M1820_001369 [Bogoriella megaspora]
MAPNFLYKALAAFLAFSLFIGIFPAVEDLLESAIFKVGWHLAGMVDDFENRFLHAIFWSLLCAIDLVDPVFCAAQGIARNYRSVKGRFYDPDPAAFIVSLLCLSLLLNYWLLQHLLDGKSLFGLAFASTQMESSSTQTESPSSQEITAEEPDDHLERVRQEVRLMTRPSSTYGSFSHTGGSIRDVVEYYNSKSGLSCLGPYSNAPMRDSGKEPVDYPPVPTTTGASSPKDKQKVKKSVSFADELESSPSEEPVKAGPGFDPVGTTQVAENPKACDVIRSERIAKRSRFSPYKRIHNSYLERENFRDRKKRLEELKHQQMVEPTMVASAVDASTVYQPPPQPSVPTAQQERAVDAVPEASTSIDAGTVQQPPPRSSTPPVQWDTAVEVAPQVSTYLDTSLVQQHPLAQAVTSLIDGTQSITASGVASTTQAYPVPLWQPPALVQPPPAAFIEAPSTGMTGVEQMKPPNPPIVSNTAVLAAPTLSNSSNKRKLHIVEENEEGDTKKPRAEDLGNTSSSNETATFDPIPRRTIDLKGRRKGGPQSATPNPFAAILDIPQYPVPDIATPPTVSKRKAEDNTEVSEASELEPSNEERSTKKRQEDFTVIDEDNRPSVHALQSLINDLDEAKDNLFNHTGNDNDLRKAVSVAYNAAAKLHKWCRTSQKDMLVRIPLMHIPKSIDWDDLFTGRWTEAEKRAKDMQKFQGLEGMCRCIGDAVNEVAEEKVLDGRSEVKFKSEEQLENVQFVCKCPSLPKGKNRNLLFARY